MLVFPQIFSDREKLKPLEKAYFPPFIDNLALVTERKVKQMGFENDKNHSCSHCSASGQLRGDLLSDKWLHPLERIKLQSVDPWIL